jgi:hypothetical protein
MIRFFVELQDSFGSAGHLRSIALSAIADEIGRRAQMIVGRHIPGDVVRIAALRRACNDVRRICGLKPWAFPDAVPSTPDAEEQS